MTLDHRHADLAADASFKAWLYRPFLDLGPAEATGNHHLAGVTFAYKAMAERRRYPRLHGVILPSARKAMVRAARLPAFDVDDPLDLDRGAAHSRMVGVVPLPAGDAKA